MSESRQRDVRNPHFQVPFRFGGLNGGAFVNEQDTFDDVQDCIKAIVAYPTGSRQELPEFGSPDLPFVNDPTHVPIQIQNAIARWEPRPAATVDGDAVVTEAMILEAMTRAGLDTNG